MTKVTLNVGITTAGHAVYTMQVGDRRVRFDAREAQRLLSDWPNRIGTQAALCAARGEPFLFSLGAAEVRLSSTESSQLAGLDDQLRSLMDTARRIQVLPGRAEPPAAALGLSAEEATPGTRGPRRRQ
jgi:hypothetical protein